MYYVGPLVADATCLLLYAQSFAYNNKLLQISAYFNKDAEDI